MSTNKSIFTRGYIINELLSVNFISITIFLFVSVVSIFRPHATFIFKASVAFIFIFLSISPFIFIFRVIVLSKFLVVFPFPFLVPFIFIIYISIVAALAILAPLVSAFLVIFPAGIFYIFNHDFHSYVETPRSQWKINLHVLIEKIHSQTMKTLKPFVVVLSKLFL